MADFVFRVGRVAGVGVVVGVVVHSTLFAAAPPLAVRQQASVSLLARHAVLLVEEWTLWNVRVIILFLHYHFHE